MEFSAKLVLSSNSGYCEKRVSFFQSVSADWQALLSALEGKAADCKNGATLSGGGFVSDTQARTLCGFFFATVSILWTGFFASRFFDSS